MEFSEYLEQQGYKPTDTIALVSYSVKPTNINTTGWIAGNGEISGDWIIDKTLNVSLKNGEFTIIGTGF